MNDNFRKQFPALQRQYNNDTLVFLDGPGGTQVPTQVIDAVSNYYKTSNANAHGAFITAQETDVVLDSTREKMAHFLGAEGPSTISVGANMTTLTYSLSKAIARKLQPGDEILITQLDHEANRGPWLALRENGIIVREVRLKPTGVLDYEDLHKKLNERTRLVAMGWASNILGTVNDVKRVREMAYECGAWLLLDAVHYAPHFPVDVQALGCDFLLCSAYKFYGPHVGLLYARPGLLDQLATDRLRTAPQAAPFKIETGTQNHAALAGVAAAVDFIASYGDGTDYRTQLLNAMTKIRTYEKEQFIKMYTALTALPGIEAYGLPGDEDRRTPTIALTVEGKRPGAICEILAQHNICAWGGHFYALRSVEVLGLLEKGGVTRLGLSAYTSDKDIDRTVEAFKKITNS
jgi:cysteine desulfurase family protein (TIGR01976 family)